MKETIEVVPGPDGTFTARATWGEKVMIDKPLPRGFETWPDDEQRAHFSRFIVPRLKALIARARAGKALVAIDGEDIVQDEVAAEDIQENEERLRLADEKRERKAAKLKLVS